MTDIDYDTCIGKKEKTNSIVHFFDSNDDFDIPETEEQAEDWYKKSQSLWKGMPEFQNDGKEPFKQLLVSFMTEEDYKTFQTLINQVLTNKTRSIWFPEREQKTLLNKFWIDTGEVE